MFDAKAQARFWDKAERRGPDDCWEWQAARSRQGYGTFWFANRMWRASQLSLIIAGSTKPDGFEACHKCDNPPCVNPKHLFWGTHSQNMAGMYTRGRNIRISTDSAPLTNAEKQRRHRDKRDAKMARYEAALAVVATIDGMTADDMQHIAKTALYPSAERN